MSTSNTEPLVYIVDDDEAVRKSLRLLIQTVGLDVATYDSARAFLADFDRDRPGCVLLDVRMPGCSGLELQERLRAAGSDIPVIIMTGHGDVPVAVRAMRGGAVDVMEKTSYREQELLETIQDALERDIANREAKKAIDETERRIATLTNREHQIMELLVAGKPNKVIAYELNVSIKTVETHRSKILEKMNVRSLVDLARIVVETRSASNAS